MTCPAQAPAEHADAQAKPVLRLRGISKRFGDLFANKAIDFDLFAGQTLCLLGENGAGKTTLMNILFGHHVADSGTIEAFGAPLPPGDPACALAVGIGMVHQHFALAQNLTVLENIVVGTEWALSWRLRRAAARTKLKSLMAAFALEVPTEAAVGSLSVGEQQRVEILKALYRDSKVLILDEPTAALTLQQAQALSTTLSRMTAAGMAIIFISHKLDEVLNIADRIVVLRSGQVVANVAARDADAGVLAQLMIGRNIEAPCHRLRSAGPARVSLDAVTVRRADGRIALDRVSLEVRAGEIMSVAGVSGNGQTSLSDLLSGIIAPTEGSYRLDGEDVSTAGARALVMRGVGRVPEDRHASGVFGDMSIPETLMAERYRTKPFSFYRLIRWRAVRRFAEQIVSDYGVSCARIDMPARLLSGGNLQKLILGRALAHDPHFILANQPSRGLDIGAAAYVRSKLVEARDRGAAILLITDDLDEVLSLSDRVVVIFRGRLSPPQPRAGLTVETLGLAMAGQDIWKQIHAL
jgi:ABC-type uncharacterized transport system ATPase subunit